MSKTSWFMKNVLMRIAIPRIKRMMDKQASLHDLPYVIPPTSKSAQRFHIPLEMVELFKKEDDFDTKMRFPIRRMLSCMKNIHLSVDSITENPLYPLTTTTDEFLEKIKVYGKDQGISQIGFVKLPQDLIFTDFGVLYDNVIMLSMEMSKELIDKSPSQATANMVFGTYDDLGKATNKLTKFLRDHGYAAQADHPLGGLVLFPPLAQKAGLGWVGKHGLLITKKYGPRVRLAAVYTSITNLPFATSNDHEWISDYCKLCGICIKQFPPKAILEETILHDSGRITNISQRDCFRYFAEYYGCSVCVKVCPFSKDQEAYERLRAVVERKKITLDKS